MVLRALGQGGAGHGGEGQPAKVIQDLIMQVSLHLVETAVDLLPAAAAAAEVIAAPAEVGAIVVHLGKPAGRNYGYD